MGSTPISATIRGYSANGNTFVLQTNIIGSIPISSIHQTERNMKFIVLVIILILLASRTVAYIYDCNITINKSDVVERGWSINIICLRQEVLHIKKLIAFVAALFLLFSTSVSAATNPSLDSFSYSDYPYVVSSGWEQFTIVNNIRVGDIGVRDTFYIDLPLNNFYLDGYNIAYNDTGSTIGCNLGSPFAYTLICRLNSVPVNNSTWSLYLHLRPKSGYVGTTYFQGQVQWLDSNGAFHSSYGQPVRIQAQ